MGSGAKPYRTYIDLSGPAYRCTCPSRKFPCKHVLGLLLLWSDGTVPAAAGLPDRVAEWIEGRHQREARSTARRERGAAGEAPSDPEAARRRAEQRERRVAAGLDELDRWLRDQVRHGRLLVRRVWLRGRETGRMALVLHFAAPGQPLDASLVTGRSVDAELAFYPDGAALRALVARRHATVPARVPRSGRRRDCARSRPGTATDGWWSCESMGGAGLHGAGRHGAAPAPWRPGQPGIAARGRSRGRPARPCGPRGRAAPRRVDRWEGRAAATRARGAGAPGRPSGGAAARPHARRQPRGAAARMARGGRGSGPARARAPAP